MYYVTHFASEWFVTWGISSLDPATRFESLLHARLVVSFMHNTKERFRFGTGHTFQASWPGLTTLNEGNAYVTFSVNPSVEFVEEARGVSDVSKMVEDFHNNMPASQEQCSTDRTDMQTESMRRPRSRNLI